MPDSPKKLSIPIETPANLTGLKETTAGLKDVGDAAKKGGKDNEEAGKKAEFLGLKVGELKKLTRELGREFPIAGYAARLFLNPIAAAFTIAIAIFAKAKEAIDEMNKSLDEAGEKAADPTFLEGIEARKAALESGEREAAAFERRMARVVDQEVEYTEAVRNAIEATHAMAEADQRLADAQLGIDSEILKRKLQNNLITQSDYYKQLLELEKNYEAEKLTRQKAAHAQEIKLLQDELAEIKSHIGPDSESATNAIINAATSRGRLEKNKSDLKKLQDSEKDAKTEFDKADKTIQSQGGVDQLNAEIAMLQSGLYANGTAKIAAIQKQIEEYTAALGKWNQLRNAIRKIKTSLPGQESDQAIADDDAKNKSAIAEKEKSDAQAAEREIKRNRAELGLSEDTASAESDAKINADKLKTPLGGSGFTGADIDIAAHLEQQKALFAKHTAGVKDLTDSQKQWLAGFEQYFGVTQSAQDKTLQLLYKLVGSQTTAAAKLEAFNTLLDQALAKVAKLESRSGTPPPR